MATGKTISKEITVNATPANVWQVFINPAVTRQMGGEYVSDWKAGGTIGWKGNDGHMLTRGTILQVEPGKILQHNLADMADKDVILSVVTYKFIDHHTSTVLRATEQLNYDVSDTQFEEIGEGWDAALSAVKEIAERLAG
jgi:uncharacterized protein YndB with AHSA1/START domain